MVSFTLTCDYCVFINGHILCLTLLSGYQRVNTHYQGCPLYISSPNCVTVLLAYNFITTRSYLHDNCLHYVILLGILQ